MRKCIHCGATLDADDIFCGECGGKQETFLKNEIIPTASVEEQRANEEAEKQRFEEERAKIELEKQRLEEERIRSELEKEEIARAKDIEARTFLGILFDTVELANEARWKHEQERMEIEIRAKAEAEIKARIEEERRIKTEQEEARIKAETAKKRQEEERIKAEAEKKRQEEERIQGKAEKKRLEEEKAKEESLKLRTVRGVVYDTIEAASGAKKEHDEIDELVKSVGKQSKQKTRQSIVANKEMHVNDVYAKKRLEALKTKVNQEEPRIVSLKRILGILVVVVFVAFILAAMCQAPGAILGLVATSWWIALIAFIVVVIICGVNKKKSDWYLNLKDI